MTHTQKEELTSAEINQILSLIKDNEREGSYYGRKDQYWKRSESIKKKLIEMIKKTDNSDLPTA